MQRSPWLIAVMAAAVFALSASSASADTYTVYSCKGPTGTPNPATGWVEAPGASGVGHVSNACANAGPLSAYIDVDPSGTASASWAFGAPSGTTIVRFTAQRRTTGIAAGPARQPNDVQYILLADDKSTLESCSASDTSSCVADLSQPLDKPGLTASLVRFRVLCTNVGFSCPRALRADYDSMQVGLQDTAAPTVTDSRVIDNGDVSGVLKVGFNAADVGGGVYRAIVKVDTKAVTAIPLGGGDCTDANPNDGDPYEFLVPVPCPSAVNNAVVQVNYRSLTPGPHGVEVDVEDAAGNTTAVYGPISFPRLNTEAAPSTPSAISRLLNAKLRVWFVKSNNKRYTSVYGTRVVTRGILRDSKGKAVRGARIDVYHRLRSGARRLLKTGLKTRADGRLTLILPLNIDSRGIEFDYRAVRPGKITSRQILNLRVLRNGRTFVRKLKART